MGRKHRESVFTVIREEKHPERHGVIPAYQFDAIIGTYFTLQRAEEVAAASLQAFKDAGVPDGVYRFSAQINTYYDE